MISKPGYTQTTAGGVPGRGVVPAYHSDCDFTPGYLQQFWLIPRIFELMGPTFYN